MAEKEDIGNNDSKKSEFSSLEEIDLDGQIEIISPEKDTVEPLEVVPEEVVGEVEENGPSQKAVPEEVVSEEAENGSSQEELPQAVVSEETESGSGQSDSDVVDEIKLPPNSDEVKTERSPKNIGAENSLQTADEPGGGQSDRSKLDDPYFLGVDEEESDDEPPKQRKPHSINEGEEIQKNGKSEIKSKEDIEPAESQNDRNDKDRDSTKIAGESKAKTIIGNWSLTQIIIGVTLLLMGFAGGVIYMNPAHREFKKEAIPVDLKTKEPSLAVVPASKQVESAKPLSKNDIYLAKIREAGILRDELLAKKEEIYQLKRYYQNGIIDLTDQINREFPEGDNTSYTEAIKNRRIELNLRTIQRRRFYIQKLIEPIRWIKQGREELLYLKRKAEFDLQLIDIAGGIDMDRHMRHIGAAIQKYRPSADKLAISRENADLTPLETIWGQIKAQKPKNGQVLSNEMDKEITEEICSGNYERAAELTSMSAEAARCLSKKPGSDLFLNGLTALSPTTAEHLLQWRGGWICINGIKELSPAAAQHLFKWEGNWISLNGLTEFAPELATYLMEWEGDQLELMGLRYDKKNSDQQTLKYLALWEAMGGKLFVADDVRQEIERVTM
jgi:hypothetical protein